MKHGKSLSLFLSLVLFTAFPIFAQDMDTVSLTAKVVRIIDGDTVVVEFENPPFAVAKNETVRFLGIDTPEMTTSGRGSPPEPYALEAKALAELRLLGKQVTLYFETVLRDRFGRILAYVILEDGTMFNKEPLALGLAKVYRNITCAYQREFLTIERSAIISRAGVWGKLKDGVRVTAVMNNAQSEYVELINLTSAPVSLKNWRLKDRKRNILTITEAVTLAPGQAMRFHSGMPEPRTGREDIYLSKQSIWNNNGDTVFVIDTSGRIVDKYEY